MFSKPASQGLYPARAEQYPEDQDWKAEWVNDDCFDLSWMSEDELQQPHEVLGCVLKDAEGNVLASLWGIVDTDRNYSRVVEAELAAEAPCLRFQIGSGARARAAYTHRLS